MEGIVDTGTVSKVIILVVILAVTTLVDRFVSRVARHALEASSIPSATIFVNIIRGVIWAFGILATMRPVFGIEPTAFVTALGISSVVLSFGLQDTVSNVFSGLVIMMSKVVKPGDYISVGGFEGFVVDVTWRQTCVADRVGNTQIIPNSVLNKTAFTRKGESGKGFCELELALKADIDVDKIAALIEECARESLADVLDPAFDVKLAISSADAYGIHASVWLHVRDDVAFGSVKDRLARSLMSTPWFQEVVFIA